LQTWLDWVNDDQAEKSDTSAEYKEEDEVEHNYEEEHVIVMTDPCSALGGILERVSCTSKASHAPACTCRNSLHITAQPSPCMPLLHNFPVVTLLP
jgi:hypothetical protein